MILRIYRHGAGHEDLVIDQKSLVIEMIDSSQRTVQLSFSDEGGVNLRGWGNEPRLLGNWSRLDLSASLPKEEPLPVEQQCHY